MVAIRDWNDSFVCCAGKEIYATFEYVMKPKSAAENGGEGLCVYICDPEVSFAIAENTP